MPRKGLVEVMKRYRATYERDEDGYWSVVVKVGLRQAAISDGQTLPKARRRIRQALALLLDVPEDSLEIVDDVKLPAPAMRALKRLQATQLRLERQARETDQARRKVAAELDRLGISRRDAGDLLGVSGARVQQLLD